MKLILYCCGAAEHLRRLRPSPAEYDADLAALAAAPLRPLSAVRTATDRPLYVSSAPAAAQTAMALFGRADVTVTPLLDEIPARSFADRAPRLPLWLWDGAARLQWYGNSARQPEGRRETCRRARTLWSLLEERGQDCILITHPRFLRVLLDQADRRTYEIRGGQWPLAPLEKIAVVPAVPHCGNCGHNCPLSRPGCDIGREKALALAARRK
ncbi:MAG: histidine phosphatase family protein [Oscillibacter sp.]|nr:histidine phosphatase family protein [Oscillibacter sp.]